MKNILMIDDSAIDMATKIDILALLEAKGIKYTIKDFHAPRCPVCGSKNAKDKRTVALFAELVSALNRVFLYCKSKNEYSFTRKEIKERCLASMGENVTARFGDWKLFGGLIYTPDNEGKEKKGYYAFNIERTEAFLTNQLSIPTKLVLYKDGRETDKLDYKTIKEIPKLSELLDEDGKYRL